MTSDEVADLLPHLHQGESLGVEMRITETGSANERKYRKLRLITRLAREINTGRRSSSNNPMKAARAAGYTTARFKQKGLIEMVVLIQSECPAFRPSRPVREAMRL